MAKSRKKTSKTPIMQSHTNALTQLLESELREAIEDRDSRAITRFSLIVGDQLQKNQKMENDIAEIKTDVRVLAETMKKGFEQVDKRFEDMNKKFTMMFAFFMAAFSLLTVLITIFKFMK